MVILFRLRNGSSKSQREVQAVAWYYYKQLGENIFYI